MPVFISLLRGVNVGQCRVKMSELQSVYEKLGYTEVQTYVQSGNVVFSAPARIDHAKQIRVAVREAFGFDIPGLVVSAKRLAQIARANPFLKNTALDPGFLHFTFLLEPSGQELSGALPKTGEESAVLVADGIYLYCPHGYGRTKLHNGYFERVLKVPATTRNWRTVLALEKLANR